MEREPIVILLVEDDFAHAEIVRRSLDVSNISSRLEHVADGQAALDYLFRRNEFIDPLRSPRPAVVLLDLRLPKVDGLDVLKTIKSDPGLASIPVVILTTSAAEADMAKAYECHANSYLVKPVEFAHFMDLLHTLRYYWLVWNQPASREDKGSPSAGEPVTSQGDDQARDSREKRR